MMTPVEALTYAVVMAAACSYLLWLLPGPCKCEKCAFHVNERRVARLAKDEAQREEVHNINHKGFGYGDKTPDRMSCPDEQCSRNPKPKA